MAYPQQDIFCNSPWYELHIYWDGSLGFCCQATHKLYPPEQASRYNIKNTSIADWYRSAPMDQARLAMWGQEKNTWCHSCYQEESLGLSSRRQRSNLKSVIFIQQWQQSFEQSPGRDKFQRSRDNQGHYTGMPIDLHIDLGNQCNLSCKMCSPRASSAIAAQHRRWGILSEQHQLITDWTQDTETWNRVLHELSGISNLRNVHFMGGETLITPKFQAFVDHMIDHGRTDLNFSFVTNGTIWRQDLMDKLQKFGRIGIEVSIETLTEHNAYQRQGTDTASVLENISRYSHYCDGDQRTLTLRPAVSALTIGNYPSLLQYCLDNRIIVKSLLCHSPRHYDPRILPVEIKTLYESRYLDFYQHNQLQHIPITDYNYSDPNEIKKIISNQVDFCLGILRSPPPEDQHRLLSDLVSWCRRWDDVHGYDARALYPEFRDILDQHGY